MQVRNISWGKFWGIMTLTNIKSSMDVQIRLRIGYIKSAKGKEPI
jgi:hypothetical protein